MSYGAEIRVAVGGLEKLKLLEDRVSQLQGRFTKLNAAIANLGKFAQPKLNIDTRMAERQIAGLRRQIQSLNTGTTTVKVRTVFENSGSSGSSRGGSGAAAAAAAGAFGGFSASGSAAAMRKISESMGSSRGSGGSSSLAAMTRELKDLADGLRTDLLPAERELQLRQKAINDAYTKSLSTIRAVTAAIGGNEGAIAELNQQLAAAKAKLASLNGVPSTFADELSADITAATERLKELNRELKLNQNRLLSANFKADGFNQLGNSLPSPAVVSGQARLEEARKRLPRGAGVVGNALGAATTLVGTYAGVSGLQQLGQASIQRTTADLGLKANTEQLGEYQQATKAVAEQVKLLGLSQTEATKNFTTAYAALRPLGLQLETVNKLQQGFVATARASGRSVEEATSSWRQYVQAIGKGRLNGDELVSISENAPQLYQQLAKELKVNVGALKDLGEEGKITADVLVKAGLALRDGSLTKLEKILQGPQQQLKNLGNEFENLGVALGKAFGPALGQELKGFVDGVKGVTQWVSKLTPAQGKLVVESVKLAAQLFLVSKAIQAIQAAGAVVTFLRTLAATQVAVGTSAGGATVLVNGLALALGRLAAIGVVTVGFKWLGDAKTAGDQIEALEQRLRGGGTGKSFSPQTNSREQIQQAQSTARKTIATAQAELDRIKKESEANSWLYGIPGVGAAMAGMAGSRATTLNGRILDAQSVLQLKPDQFQTQAQRSQAELAGLLQGVPVPGTDPKDTKKAADEAQQAAERLAADKAQLDKALAASAIALDNQVFQNRQNLLQQQYELERQLQEKTANNWSMTFTGAGRDQAGLINQLNSNLQGYGDKIKELQSQIAAAEQKVKAAKAGVGVAQIQPATVLPMGAGVTAVAGAGRLPGSISGRLDASGQNGGDMPVGVNNAIKSYHNGVVKELGRAGNNGNYVVIEFLDDLGNRLEATYSHLAATVKKGETVVGGQVIGRFDGSGRTFGAHNSVDINSLGNNGAFQRSQETPAARRAADLLIQGKVLGGPGGAPGATGNSSPLAGADSVAAAVGDVSTAQAELQGLNDQLTSLQSKVGGLQQADFAGFILQSTDAFRSQAAEIKNSTAQLQLRNRLEMEGVRPEIIAGEESKLQISQELQERVAALDAGLTLYNETQGKAGISAAQHAEALAGITANAGAAAQAIDALTKAQLQAADPITQLYKQWNLEINDTRSQIASLAGTVQSELAGAMSNAITGVIQGTTTVQQAFSTMFKNIGAAFIDMATQMIAKALIMKVLGILGGGLGGGGTGSNFGGGGPGAGLGDAAMFAEGGFVTSATPAVFGEAGPEYAIPESKMGAAMANYSAGKRGAAVLEGGSSGGADGQGGGGITVDYTGPMLRFNSEDYLPKSAVPEIINAAAKRGADGGHARVMGDFRNKRSTRSRLGVR